MPVRLADLIMITWLGRDSTEPELQFSEIKLWRENCSSALNVHTES